MLFRRRRKLDPLRNCPACGSRFACPTDWAEADESHWHIELRCGECETLWDAVVDNARAARYDVELDLDVAAIERELRNLDLERMAHETDTFAAALSAGFIEPADFAV